MDAQNSLNLKPRTLVELIDQAFRLYRNNFIKFIGIVAFGLVPVQIIRLGLTLVSNTGSSSLSSLSSSNTLNALALNYFIILLNAILVSGVATAALTSAIASRYLGEEITISSAYSKIRKSWGRLVGALLLLFLIGIVVAIWMIIPCVGWVSGIGIALFLSLAITPLVAPVIIIENLSGMKAIRRVWDLTRRRFWWIVGYFLLITLFNLLVIQGPVLVISALIQRNILSMATSSLQISSIVLPAIIDSVSTLLLSLIFIPLQSACATLAYFDLRIRQEGFDLAVMANQTAEVPVNPVELAGQSSGTAVSKLITWKEFGYFVGLSFGAAGLYAIVIALIIAIAPGITSSILGGR